MKAQFNESSWGMGADPIKYIDGYNESLMNVYMSALVSVQQVYNILMTAAYLQANHIAGFGNLTSPVPGVNPSDSFATQQAKINAVFNNLLQGQRDSNNNLVGTPGIFDVTASLLISDYYDMSAQYPSDWSSTGLPTYAQAYANNYQPELAKTQSQMPPSWTTACTGGVCNATPWSASCNVYAWSGASAYPYTGNYGNGTLTASCNGEGTSLDLNYREANNTPLALYAYGKAMLEPENYNPTASYVILGSSSSVKAFEVKFSGSDNYFNILLQGYNPQAPWIEAFSNPGSMCTSGTCSYPWTLDSNSYIHSHSGTYSYNSINVVKFPDGYNGLINLYSQGHDVGDDNISWDFGLQCVAGVLCYKPDTTDL